MHIEDLSIKVSKHPQGLLFSLFSHPNLNENPKFLQLKAYIVQFHDHQPHRRKDKFKVRSLNWQETFYKSLLYLFYQVLYTEEPKKQTGLLDKVHEWFTEKIKESDELLRQLPEPPAPGPLLQSQGQSSDLQFKTQPVAQMPGTISLTREKLSRSRYAKPQKRQALLFGSSKARLKAVSKWQRQRAGVLHKSEFTAKPRPSPLDFSKRIEPGPLEGLRRYHSSPKKVYFDRSLTPGANSCSDHAKEIENVKNRLAARDMHCSYEVLLRGLGPLMSPVPINRLPRGGEGLMRR